MASGVTVSDKVKVTFDEVKKDKKYRYITFNIFNEKEIVVDCIGGEDF